MRRYFWWIRTLTTLSMQYLSRQKIYPTEDFAVKEDLMMQFFHAPTMPLDQLQQSPIKQRASLLVKIKQISPLKTAPDASWKRKDIIIEEDGQASTSTATLKLWNKSTDLIGDVHLNKKIKVENVEITEFNMQKHFRDTPETAITSSEDKCNVNIIAVSGKELLIIRNGLHEAESYIFASADPMPTIPSLPAAARAVLSGNTVTEIMLTTVNWKPLATTSAIPPKPSVAKTKK
ncbi:uncharacterized protein LOC135489304 isoform X2 [Lineus longissimus]|uniref:uncharacterized protein LOC135489304 isoform X2 n=1 Tax=Lineus longissimus TaxID=88925 RepID=UPI00315D6653